jgi:uncharacterized protein (TIGR03118 family)
MHPSLRARTHRGRTGRWLGALVALVAVVGLAIAPAALADDGGFFGGGLGQYAQRNLVSNLPHVAELQDPSLVNAWGLSFGPTTPAWVADNGADVSTLYSGGVGASPVVKVPLTVSIPGGAPTGTVYNGGTGFVVTSGSSSGPARFLFSSEAGKITGWNSNVPPPPPSTQAQDTPASAPGAIFKGLAIADTGSGPLLYATDFHNAKVDVWDQNFKPITTPGAFQDPAIPAGFAPFGIQAVNGSIIVTYAKQDANAEDDVAGAGLGFVDAYSTSGVLLRRFAARGTLNAPWGIALAPFGFGGASGALLIGNFGDGRINAYDPVGGRFLGQLRGMRHKPITIDGLWALEFGNGVIGTQQTLLFTAGPNAESDGLFGELTPVQGHGH